MPAWTKARQARLACRADSGRRLAGAFMVGSSAISGIAAVVMKAHHPPGARAASQGRGRGRPDAAPRSTSARRRWTFDTGLTHASRALGTRAQNHVTDVTQHGPSTGDGIGARGQLSQDPQAGDGVLLALQCAGLARSQRAGVEGGENSSRARDGRVRASRRGFVQGARQARNPGWFSTLSRKKARRGRWKSTSACVAVTVTANGSVTSSGLLPGGAAGRVYRSDGAGGLRRGWRRVRTLGKRGAGGYRTCTGVVPPSGVGWSPPAVRARPGRIPPDADSRIRRRVPPGLRPHRAGPRPLRSRQRCGEHSATR